MGNIYVQSFFYVNYSSSVPAFGSNSNCTISSPLFSFPNSSCLETEVSQNFSQCIWDGFRLRSEYNYTALYAPSLSTNFITKFHLHTNLLSKDVPSSGLFHDSISNHSLCHNKFSLHSFVFYSNGHFNHSLDSSSVFSDTFFFSTNHNPSNFGSFHEKSLHLLLHSSKLPKLPSKSSSSGSDTS